MQNIGKKSYIYREECKSESNAERNVILCSQCNKLSQQNICDKSHTNECKNCYFVDKSKIGHKFNESYVKTEVKKEISFHSSEEEMESKIKTKDISFDYSKRSMSPIEQFRNESKDWKQFHTSTSTPISHDKDVLPDLNISSISLEESDSEFLYERQISRFQITDEFINSSVFDYNEDKEEKQNE